MAKAFKVTGTTRLSKYLFRAGLDVRKASARGLNMVAEEMMTLSKERTPVDTGRLKGTGNVRHARARSGTATMTATLRYGTDYAVKVHELPISHKVGQSKFLESAVNALEKNIGVEVGRAVKRALEKGAKGGA